MKTKAELLELVDKNFNMIKENFMKAELEINDLEEVFENNEDYYNEWLNNYFNKALEAADDASKLIEMINQHSCLWDLEDGEQVKELYEMIISAYMD